MRILLLSLVTSLIFLTSPSFGEKYLITKTWLWGFTVDNVERVQTSTPSILYDKRKDCEKDLLYLVKGSIVKKIDSKGELYLQKFEKNDFLNLISFFTCTKLYGPNFEWKLELCFSVCVRI